MDPGMREFDYSRRPSDPEKEGFSNKPLIVIFIIIAVVLAIEYLF